MPEERYWLKENDLIRLPEAWGHFAHIPAHTCVGPIRGLERTDTQINILPLSAAQPFVHIDECARSSTR